MNNQDENQPRKLPVPKHLTQKEKANLMVAWARTHNKIDREAGTITYPDGRVGKLKSKMSKEEQKETPTQESKKNENKAVKVISIYIEAEIYSLSDIIEDAYAKFGEISKEMFDALKSGYASFRENADDNTYSKLDSTTRAYTYETLLNIINNNQQPQNNEQVVSKMEQMTPKERANHDLKLSRFQKAIQISKEKEKQNKTEALQPNRMAAIEEMEDIYPKTETKETAEKFLKKVEHKEIFNPSEESLKTGMNNISIGGIDPEKIKKGTKLISLYTKAGIFKFSDIVEDAYSILGESLKDIFMELKVVYSAYYNRAEDDIADQMESNVRSMTYETLINKINNDEQDNNQQDKEYQIQLYHCSRTVKEYLKQHHKNFYKSLLKDKELNYVANRRATLFLEQLEQSANPQQDKEIYFQQMLEF